MPSQPPLVPGTDAEKVAKAKTARAAMAPMPTTYGTSPSEVTSFAGLISDAEAAIEAHDAAQEQAKALRAAKDLAVSYVVEQFRQFNRTANGTAGCTDEDKLAAGFAVRADRRPIPTPAVSPVVGVTQAGRFRHDVRVACPGKPKGGKADGVAYYKLYVKVGGAAPIGPSEMTCVGEYSNGRIERTYAEGDGNKTAYYVAVACNAKGETGAPGETVAATIAA